MQDNRYGIELDANINKYKSKMKEAQNIAQETGKKIKENTKFNVWQDGKMTLTNGVELVKKSQNELNSSIRETGRISNSTGNEISRSFNKGLRSVKRLTIGFLGARSLFSLFRQQVNAYRGENEAFNQQMMLTSNIITTALAPAFEFFGNMILYATLGLAKIIDIMFGTNIAATVLANGIEKADKASADLAKDMSDANDKSKEFADNLLGLDEITNLNGEDTGTGILKDFSDRIAGINAQNEALDKFKKAMQDIDNFFNKNWLGKTLKGFAQWIRNNPWEALLGIGAFAALWKLLPLVIGGGTAGLVGVGVALGVIAGISIYEVIKQFDKLLDKIDELEEKNKQLTKQFNSVYDEGMSIATEAYKKYLDTGNQYYLKLAEEQYQSMIEYANEEAEYLEHNSGRLSWWNNIFNHDDYNKAKKELEVAKQKAIDAQKEIDKIHGKKSTATIEVKAKAETKEAEKDYSNFFSRLANNMSAFISNVVSLGKAKNKYVSLFKQNGGIFTGSWQPITAFAGGGVPDSGQMFMAREAGPELVGTIGGHTAVMNNDQIVASVSAGVYQAVVSAMGGQSDRPIVLNINGKEFAKATYGDYQEEGSRRGPNTSIRRI